MDLTTDEKTKLLSIIKRYKALGLAEQNYSDLLSDLEFKRTELISKVQTLSVDIELLRQEEKEFTDKLIKKYGEFRLDLETLEIIPPKKLEDLE